MERNQEYHEEEAAATGCGCFRRFSFGWVHTNDEAESHKYLLQERRGSTKTSSSSGWLVGKLKKMKDFSELVAGPKWKNFIRRIGKLCNPKKNNNGKETTLFQYSPESYALNFAGGEEEDGNLLHSFSSRFAPAYFTADQQRKTANF